MIKVFKKVTAVGVGDPAVLARGIWEALITTAAGLSVAIPLYLFYRFLQIRFRGVVNSTEAAIESLLEVIDQEEQ